jgi:hypothetical protein
MTDAELDLLERRARVIAGDAVRAVDMVRAERSARRSIQEQRDAALERILASNPQEGA